MPSLEDLRRQRALISEHLAWLDKQIAEASAETPSPAPSPAEPAPPSPATAEEASLVQAYQEEASQSPQRLKLGCTLVFVAALITVVGGTFAVYWFRYRS